MKKRIIFLAVTTGIIFILTISVNAQHYHGNHDDNRDFSSNHNGKGNMHQDYRNSENGRCCEDGVRGGTAVYHHHAYARPAYCAPPQVVVIRNIYRPSYCHPRPRCGTVRY